MVSSMTLPTTVQSVLCCWLIWTAVCLLFSLVVCSWSSVSLSVLAPFQSAMGNIVEKCGLTWDHLSLEPYTFPYLRKNWPLEHADSPYDPLDGFPNGRKPRVMIATQEEMDSVKLHPKLRDYCAHRYIELQGCRFNQRPFYWRCKHEKHAYQECQFEDAVIRMKEWERERRLNERAKKKAAQKE